MVFGFSIFSGLSMPKFAFKFIKLLICSPPLSKQPNFLKIEVSNISKNCNATHHNHPNCGARSPLPIRPLACSREAWKASFFLTILKTDYSASKYRCLTVTIIHLYQSLQEIYALTPPFSLEPQQVFWNIFWTLKDEGPDQAPVAESILAFKVTVFGGDEHLGKSPQWDLDITCWTTTNPKAQAYIVATIHSSRSN